MGVCGTWQACGFALAFVAFLCCAWEFVCAIGIPLCLATSTCNRHVFLVFCEVWHRKAPHHNSIHCTYFVVNTFVLHVYCGVCEEHTSLSITTML